jgi:hypothetical protein
MTWLILPRLPYGIGALAVALSVLSSTFAADVAKIKFDLPADVVARSIKTFAQQSGKEILISAELGREIRTSPVKGEFTPREAVDRMLSRTGLMAKQDEKTGAMVIMVAVGESGQNGAAKPNADAHSTVKKKILTPTPKP